MNILYEDKEILVCHKPAGIPVQSASVREKDMVSILKNQTGGEIYVVHRLDQPVEGVLVFAKTKSAAAKLSRQAADGSMKKIYHALVVLNGETETGKADAWHTLADYLVKDARKNMSFVSDKNNKDAKRAKLRFRILKQGEEPVSVPDAETKLALAEIELKTGRHHQIRVQMAHAGMPLAGDRKYNPLWQGDLKTPALCAVSFSFHHPSSKKLMRFETKPSVWPAVCG